MEALTGQYSACENIVSVSKNKWSTIKHGTLDD